PDGDDPARDPRRRALRRRRGNRGLLLQLRGEPGLPEAARGRRARGQRARRRWRDQDRRARRPSVLPRDAVPPAGPLVGGPAPPAPDRVRVGRHRALMKMTVKALTFDTYGTVVDWRSSVLSELEAFGAARRLGLDWSAFLADWRSCYRPGMEKVNSGEWPWTTVDAIYRRRLDELHGGPRSEEHTSELQSLRHLVCRLLLEKKKVKNRPFP